MSKLAGLPTSRHEPPPVGWKRDVIRMVRGQRPAAANEPADSPFTDADASPFSASAADALVRQGLSATLLAELANSSGIEPKLLYEFAGIDRTTVARRVARQDVLPQDAAVKALEFAELVAIGVDVFGSVADAVRWLSLTHPALDGDTPLQRARTPWGLTRVRAVLGALKYGGVV